VVTFPPSVYKDSFFLASSPTFVVGGVLNDSYSNRSKVESFFFIIHLFTCAYIVWVISPPCPPCPPSSLFPSQFQAGLVLPLSLVLLKKRHKHSKEDKVFLLVELRIAIQKYS
jgi:hypothetical protein